MKKNERTGLYLPDSLGLSLKEQRDLFSPYADRLTKEQMNRMLPPIGGASSITGTWTECLYAMPVSGPAVTAAAATIMTGNTAANPPYLLPAGFFQQQSGSGVSKALLLKGGGWCTVGGTAVTDIFTVGMNTTAGTLLNTVAKTGTFTTVINMTSLAFTFEVMMTVTIAGSAANAGSINCVGELKFMAANNADAPTWGTYAAATTSLFCVMGIGTPQTAVTLNPTLAYYIELFNQWSVTTGAPTITLTNFYILGLN
jgi:hypothetical protein